MKVFISTFTVLANLTALSQGTVRDTTIGAPLVGIHGGGYIPAVDMAERFGPNAAIGGSFNYKFSSQWTLGVDYTFHFGKRVREDSILNSMKTSTGFVIAGNGIPANILLQERGHSVTIQFGRLFPVFGPNPNSGLITRAGVGFFQHKIRIETANDYIPQLTDDLKKGYDRMSNGTMLSGFVGYQHLSNSKLINFYIGLEFNLGLTAHRRSYNYDTRQSQLGESRTDILYGIKGGWILPIYKRSPEKYYY